MTEAARAVVETEAGAGPVAELRAVAVKGLAAVAMVAEVETAMDGAMEVEVEGAEREAAVEVAAVCRRSIRCKSPRRHRSGRSGCR